MRERTWEPQNVYYIEHDFAGGELELDSASDILMLPVDERGSPGSTKKDR